MWKENVAKLLLSRKEMLIFFDTFTISLIFTLDFPIVIDLTYNIAIKKAIV